MTTYQTSTNTNQVISKGSQHYESTSHITRNMQKNSYLSCNLFHKSNKEKIHNSWESTQHQKVKRWKWDHESDAGGPVNTDICQWPAVSHDRYIPSVLPVHMSYSSSPTTDDQAWLDACSRSLSLSLVAYAELVISPTNYVGRTGSPDH